MIAKHPPMGWNSWDCYGAAVTEDIVRQNAAYMAEHLKDYGLTDIVFVNNVQAALSTTWSKRFHLPLYSFTFFIAIG